MRLKGGPLFGGTNVPGGKGVFSNRRRRLVTVFIAPDARRLQLVWHSTLRVRSNETEQLESTIVGEKSYV